ncbi:hypothetical protein AB0E75_30555, partial [Streptomyces griseoviridis]
MGGGGHAIQVREAVTRRHARRPRPSGTGEAGSVDFLRARFDAGLAWVHFPEGLGGLGAPRT